MSTASSSSQFPAQCDGVRSAAECDDRSSRESKPSLLRCRRDHAAVAVRPGRSDASRVRIEAVTPEGLKDVYKGFNQAGEALVERLRRFREHGVYVLGSFIFGLPSDRPSTFAATADVADREDLAFAQFVMLTPYPGTADFETWEKKVGAEAEQVAGIPVTRLMGDCFAAASEPRLPV